MKFMISLSDPKSRDVQLVGKKASTLSHLLALGFPVPQGFVVTTTFFRKILASSNVEQFTQGAQIESCIPERLFSDVPHSFNEELQNSIASFPVNTRFAVRSSSPFEDSSSASFAGQFDTYLNCAGFSEVREAVEKCIQSLWSERSMAYRRFHNVCEDGEIAVLVQKMVDSDVSGVAFSINPISGNFDQIVVNAHAGLGEIVVDGEGDVNQLVINKADGCIVEDTGDERILSNQTLSELSKTVLELESVNAFPQDVEWALHNGELSVLQSRPISAFKPRWTRERSAERFPYPVTPLIWEVIEEGFHKSLKYSLDLMGLPPFSGKWFTSADHYVYFNQNASEMYAKCVTAPAYHLRKGTSGIRPMLEGMAWLKLPAKRWERSIDTYIKQISELNLEPFHEMDESELWAAANKIRNIAYKYFEPNFAISFGHGLLMRSLRATIELIDQPDRDVDTIMADLTIGCETKTGLFNDQLQELASNIASDAPLRSRILALKADEALHVIRGNSSVRDEFEELLAAHYHREVDHLLDPFYPSLGEQPERLIDNIQLILQGGVRSEHMMKQSVKRHFDAVTSLLVCCPREHQGDLLQLIHLTRHYIGLDDTEHYQTSRLHTSTRACLLAIGNILSNRGILKESIDICFVGFDTLGKAIQEGCWVELSKEVTSNMASFQLSGDTTAPWSLDTPEEFEDVNVDSSLSGMACSGGVTEGTVKILKSSSDFNKVNVGDILVARATPPSWTSLFYNAGAVVTEAGSPLCHGAVIAREVGIPAVMGIRGVMELLSDGDRIRVDGDRGFIIRID